MFAWNINIHLPVIVISIGRGVEFGSALVPDAPRSMISSMNVLGGSSLDSLSIFISLISFISWCALPWVSDLLLPESSSNSCRAMQATGTNKPSTNTA